MSHLWITGSGANRIMRGVRLTDKFNLTTGTALVAVPSETSNIPRTHEVPIKHLRPYVASLDGRRWTTDNPADASHPNMLVCSEPGCVKHATHDDGTTECPYYCCSNHCTCFDHYTGAHLHADGYEVSVSTGPPPLSPTIPGAQEVYLSESKLRVYWDRVRDIPKKVKGGIEVIRYGPNVPMGVLKYVRHHIKRLRRVFESNTNGIPMAVKVDPVKIRLKPNARPKRCPQPKWGYGAKMNVMTKWAKQQLKSGMFEHARDSPWASRPHIAHKAIRGTSKDDDVFDVRIVGDYVYVNSQIQRGQPNNNDAHSQILHAAGKHAYWYTDGDQQYQGWTLDKESRNTLAVWTPIGLLRPTRLQFGETNAGIVTQGDVTIMLDRDLSPEHRANIINGADDFTGFADHVTRDDGTVEIDWMKLAKSFIAMIEMADKNDMSLKASKTFFGSPEADFWGHTLDKDGHRAAIHNLDPIQKMVPPENISELRRVLGLMVQHKDSIPSWAFDARPLHELTRKNVEWEWTDERNTAFELLRDACLANRILAAPDYQKPFRVGCDASDDGKGVQLYQLTDLAKPDTPNNRNTIAYYSKSWSPAMSKRPPYYKEADVLITGLTLARPYADASKFPIKAITDHAPLQWIKTAAKGPVTGWRIENLAGMDYDVEYRPGPQNGIPDALSRYPFLGPRRLTRVGTENALSFLLETLPTTTKFFNDIWFWAARDTLSLVKRVKAWRAGKPNYLLRSPKSAVPDKSWDFAICIPRTDNATAACREIIKSKRPACVLLPNDLVHLVSQNMDGTYDVEMSNLIQKSPKYTMLAAGLTWVCFHVPDAPQHVVYASEHIATDYMPPHVPEMHAATVGTLIQWIAEQPASLEKERDLLISTRIGTTDSGLTTYTLADSPRIYVPIDRRRPLYEFQHDQINHQATLKTFNELAKTYFWPHMKRNVRKWYEQCTRCELLKAKRNLTHSQYSSRSGEAPRKRWAMDFHGVGATNAKANVLGAIDLDSYHVELAVMEHRTAENVMRFVRDRILFDKGTPQSIHSDHARELIGRVMTDLAKTFGYINTSTGGYCPMGNSVIESFWSYFNICLRDLSDAEYANIGDHLQHIAWAWNTTVHTTTGVRPFEVMTGTSPVTLTDALVLPPTTGPVNMSNIRAAARAYAQHAREHAEFMRAERARILNSRGRELKSLKVGQYVKIYVPPSQGEAVRRRRKAKHICQWRGPLQISKRLSNTTFELKSYFNPSKSFRRHLMNIRKWRGPMPSANTDQSLLVPFVSDVEVGEFCIIRDSPTATTLYLARVTAVDDLTVNVACWGCTYKSQISAKFAPVVIMEESDLPTTKPQAGKASSPWTWGCRADLMEEMFLVRDLVMLPSGKIDVASRKKLRALLRRSPTLKMRQFTS